MTHHPSRKQFVAKLLGAAAALSALPKLFAKSAAESSPSLVAPGVATKAGFRVQVDARAVARRAETI